MKLHSMDAAKTPKNLSSLRFPLYASYKIDGIRCLVISPERYTQETGRVHTNRYAVAVSRASKALPNRHIQDCFNKARLIGLDGELTVGPPNQPNTMQSSMSGIMTHGGVPDFYYSIFDMWNRGQTPYEQIIWPMAFLTSLPGNFKLLEQILISTPQQILDLEQKAYSEGYEGLILRDPKSPYKFGRSTLKEQYLVKVKRTSTGEAEVVDTKPVYHNANDPVINELGRTSRSSHQENKEPIGMLGAFLVRDITTGVRFSVGAGSNLTFSQRIHLWNNRKSLVGKTITYKHFNQTGVVAKPRHPIFVAFRDKRDL